MKRWPASINLQHPVQEGQAVLSALLDLQQSIVLANPLIQQQQQKAQSISDKPSSVDELWAAVDSSYSSIGQFRDSSLDRWYRKTLIGSGQALLKGNQRLLQQSISAQVILLRMQHLIQLYFITLM